MVAKPLYEREGRDPCPLAGCRKSPPSAWKVKVQAKAEMKTVRSSLNLDLSLPRLLRPCWTALRSGHFRLLARRRETIMMMSPPDLRQMGGKSLA